MAINAVLFDRFGDSSVLHVGAVPDVVPGPGEVVVAVATAGINPGEIPIREGLFEQTYPTTLPSGLGSDFAGVVTALGEGVTSVSVGDEVIGLSDERNALASSVRIAADRVVPLPEGLDWDVAGALYVSSTTARAAVDAVAPKLGETVVVSGAAGGVGILVTQLAVRAGARVLAVAGPDHAALIESVGGVPVPYGEGLDDRLRQGAPSGIDALIDTHGGGYVDLGVALGVPLDRIETIIDFEASGRLGTKALGMASVLDPAAVVADTARMLAAGELVLPIRRRYPLDEVRVAYDELASGHGAGKIVLRIGSVAGQRSAPAE